MSALGNDIQSGMKNIAHQAVNIDNVAQPIFFLLFRVIRTSK